MGPGAHHVQACGRRPVEQVTHQPASWQGRCYLSERGPQRAMWGSWGWWVSAPAGPPSLTYSPRPGAWGAAGRRRGGTVTAAAAAVGMLAHSGIAPPCAALGVCAPTAAAPAASVHQRSLSTPLLHRSSPPSLTHVHPPSRPLSVHGLGLCCLGFRLHVGAALRLLCLLERAQQPRSLPLHPTPTCVH